MTDLEDNRVGRLVRLNAQELLYRNLGVGEASGREVGLLELGQSLCVEGGFQLLEDISKLCKMKRVSKRWLPGRVCQAHALKTRRSASARFAWAEVVIAGAADTKGMTAAVRARKADVKCIFKGRDGN